MKFSTLDNISVIFITMHIWEIAKIRNATAKILYILHHICLLQKRSYNIALNLIISTTHIELTSEKMAEGIAANFYISIQINQFGFCHYLFLIPEFKLIIISRSNQFSYKYSLNYLNRDRLHTLTGFRTDIVN